MNLGKLLMGAPCVDFHHGFDVIVDQTAFRSLGEGYIHFSVVLKI